MKLYRTSISLLFVFVLFVLTTGATKAAEEITQAISLDSGWNIVSTPMILSSHEFSASETSENFDIYALDASSPTGWSTMADLGHTEFRPLFGYFINNKTGSTQTLTFTYESDLTPNEKLFERTFTDEGWYSIGVANGEYAKEQNADRNDTDNPSDVLSLLDGKYDLVVDFTDSNYDINRRSVAVGDPLKAVTPNDLNSLNDLRDTKGYAIYIKEAEASYIGLQNNPVEDEIDDDAEDELIVSESSNNPDSTTMQVEDDSNSDWYTIMSFNLSSGDSINDLVVESIPLSVNLSTSTFEDIVDDAQLQVAGVTISDFSVSGSSSESEITFNANSNDLMVYSGETVEAELMLRFKPLAEENNGMSVRAQLDNADDIQVQAESALDASNIHGSASGEIHTLRTAGVYISPDSTDVEVQQVDGDNNDHATYEIEVGVTGFEQDVFISTDPVTSIGYTLEDVSGNSINAPTASTTVVLESTADESGGYFEIREGETETLTLTVTYTPGNVTPQSARLQLESLLFNDDGAPGATDDTWDALPANTYRTSIITIQN